MAHDVTITLKAVDDYSSTLSKFNTAVGGISTSANELSTSAKKTSGVLDDWTKGIAAGVAAFAGWKGLQFVSDMTQLGIESNKADAVFRSLTGKMGGYTQNLEALQKATGGVVDNMTLMEGASKLVQMGLASNTEELGSMYSMAVKLGSSMGMDVTKSLSDFSLMLANNSIMRLDQFGISSGRVKERMAELADQFEGMSKSDRFKLAVMEEGRAALDRLGTAASAAETPLARIGASISNMSQAFAGDFATGVNAIAGIAELGAQKLNPNSPLNLSHDAAQASANDAAQAFAQEYLSSIGQYMNSGSDAIDFMGNGDAIKQAWGSEILKGFVALRSDPDLINNRDALMATLTNVPDAYKGKLADAITLAWSDQQFNSQAQTQAQTARDEEIAKTKAYRDLLLSIPDARQADLTAQRESVALGKQTSDALDDFQTKYNAIGQLKPFMTENEADAITLQINEAEAAFEHMKELNEQGLLNDADLKQAEDMVGYLSEMKTKADNAAEAFKNMSLAQAFGQTGGGMQGEMTDMILKQMKDSGSSPEAMAAMQRKLDLTSGRQTQSSLMMQEQIIPQMAGMSPEDVAAQMANFQALFQQAALKGLNQNQIASMMGGLGNMKDKSIDMTGGMDNFMVMMSGGYQNEQGSGMGGAGSIFDDEKGRNKGGKGGKGGTMADQTTTMRTDMSDISKNATTVDKHFASIAETTGKASLATKMIKEAMAAIPETKPIKFRISADDPDGVLFKLTALLGGTSLQEIVRNSGGAVPGATSGRGGHAGNGGV